MMARRGVLGVLAGGAAALLSGCGLFGGNSYRFKMTVEVETPQGMKTGSSVYEVSARNSVKLLPEEGARQIELKGEAVVVDLDSGPIFVLMLGLNLQPTDIVEMSMRTLDPEFPKKRDFVESAGRLSGWSQRKGDVQRTDWPMMVRFADLNDPKTVEKIDPAAIGVKRIVVETTNEAVTVGIGDRLPDTFWKVWGAIHKREMAQEGGIMKNPYFDSPAGQLSKNDFVSGVR
jgi:hypothetical protein